MFINIPRVTADQLGLHFSGNMPKTMPVQPNFFQTIKDMLPPRELLQAMGTFVPRLMPKQNSFKLTDELVPKDSIMRSVFEETEADRLAKLKSPKERLLDVKFETRKIDTPFGKIDVTSVSKNV